MEIEPKFLKNMKEQHGSQEKKKKKEHLTLKCLKEGKESFLQYSSIFRTFFFILIEETAIFVTHFQ